MDAPFEAFLPTRLVFGEGRLDEVGKWTQPLGRRALVVTSRSAMARRGYTQRVVSSLESAGITAHVDALQSETPTTEGVDQAAEQARRFRADVVIGLGGGSALDSAKATAALAPLRARCEDLLYGRIAVTAGALPLVAIPTTAGTASEMNRSAIITDPAVPHKDALRSDFLFPRVALVDPELTHDLSAYVSACTGFDAFAHAMESYVSPRAQPWADLLALASMEAVAAWLPRVLASPRDAAGRRQLALAATSMGYNLSCVGTCLPHRLDKPLCAQHPEIAHGQAVALFYAGWVRRSWPGCPERFARVSAILDPTTITWPTERAAAACSELLTSWIKRIGLSTSFSSLAQVRNAEEIAALTAGVRGDLRANPVPLALSDVNLMYYEVLQS